MRVARALDPQPGERVLDLCAAPGTKTTHLAALMNDEGTIVSVERNPARAEDLRAMAERMRARSVQVEVADARELGPDASFDRVLLDPPCSNLGTLQNRPDARWRRTPQQLDELAALQAELLTVAAAAVRPGGSLVYSTCTISPRENEERVTALLEARPDFELDGEPLQTLPHRDGSDGFYIAKLRRQA
jgi:16S rRNA (cytosine967-C5)-methyltransferase